MTRVGATKFSLPKFPPAGAQYSASAEQAFRRTLELALNGVFVATNEVVSAARGLPLLGWTHTLVFSATDHDTVAWTSGAIYLPDGTVYAIDAGNTGNITTVTYVFFDLAVSSTVLQTTTTANNAIGQNRILVAVCNDVVSGKDAQFQVFGGADAGELELVTGDVIAGSTIVGDHIVANTLNATHIATLTMTGKSCTFDTGTIGGWTLSGAQLSAGSAGSQVALQATAQRILIGAATDVMTGTGVFIGLSGGAYQIRIGDPSGADYVRFNGSAWSGRIPQAVVVHSNSFTAANPVFAGSVEIEGEDGATRHHFTTDVGGNSEYILYDSNDVEKAVITTATAGGLIVSTDFDLEFQATDDILFVAGGVFQIDALDIFLDGPFAITDGITAPSGTTGRAYIYVDVADGDLKVTFGDGITKTLATDT